jgi:hypothetical protein
MMKRLVTLATRKGCHGHVHVMDIATCRHALDQCRESGIDLGGNLVVIGVGRGDLCRRGVIFACGHGGCVLDGVMLAVTLMIMDWNAPITRSRAGDMQVSSARYRSPTIASAVSRDRDGVLLRRRARRFR